MIAARWYGVRSGRQQSVNSGGAAVRREGQGWRRFGWAAGIAMGVIVWATFTVYGGKPVDAYAYWWAAHRPAVYSTETCCLYLYSPAAYQLSYPLTALASFEVFAAILRAAEIAAVIAFAGPVSAIALWLPPVAAEINAGNVNLLLIGAVILGFRWPALWTVVLLTKPTAGLGLLWFMVRGEWRKALIPIALAAGISAVSFVLTPGMWFDWFARLAAESPDPGWPFPWPIWIRAPFALAIILWGARTNRRWALVIGTILAMPRLYFLSPAMLLGALPALRRDAPDVEVVHVARGDRALQPDALQPAVAALDQG